METKSAPTFTVTMRGYDREEVDDYLDNLAQALADLEQAAQENRALEAQITRLTARIDELEDRIRTETPRTAGALGERITLVLRQVEETAAETIAAAESEAETIVSSAREQASTVHAEAAAHEAEAEERLRDAIERAETLARRIEEEATSRAEETVSGAETQAATMLAEAEHQVARRRHDVEDWAQQVIAYHQAEQARQEAEHRAAETRHRQHLADLERERRQAVAGLSTVRDALQGAISTSERLRSHVDTPIALPASAGVPEVDDDGPGTAGHFRAGQALHAGHVEASAFPADATDDDPTQH